MKTEQEIQARIDECKSEMENLKEWHDKAYKKYIEDKSWWGKDADRGEVDHVSSLISESIKEVKLLQWVLDINEK